MGCAASATPKRDLTVAILGLRESGKTTLLYHIRDGERVDTVPTLGFNMDTIVHKGSRLTIYDVGGSDKACRLWHRAIGPAVIHGVIFVVDVNDPNSFKEANELMRREIDTDQLRNAVLLVLANKSDVPTALSVDRLEQDLSLKNFTQAWALLPASGASGYGLDAAMNWFVDSMNRTSDKANVAQQ